MTMLSKLVFCIRRHPALSLEEFHHYWLDQHGALVRSLSEAGGLPDMVRYVQSHTDHGASETARALRGGQQPYDGIAEAWFDPARRLRNDQTRGASKALLADEAKFVDVGRSSVFKTREHVILE